MASTSAPVGAGFNLNDGNSLLLYHHEQSFYSQKVIFALEEKHLTYRSQIIQLAKFEQYEPWFMRLNPKAEVPILKDGVKIIPDSSRIVEYLEDNFSNGDTPRLLPDKGTEDFQKVKYFCEKLDAIPIEDLTIGCLLHPEFTEDTKLPKYIQTRMKALRNRRYEVIQDMMVQHPDLKDSYEKKLALIQSKRRKQEQRDELLNILAQITKVLDDVETELVSHSTEEIEMWLVCEKFTVADIALAVLLHRLFVLGLAHRWWGEDRRPHLAKYFLKIRNLESYKKACMTISNYDKMMFAVEMIKQQMPLIIGTVVIVAALAVGVAFIRKVIK